MFVIRTSQMHALERASMDAFASRMVAHVEQHFPDRCRALGKAPSMDMPVICERFKVVFPGIVMES